MLLNRARPADAERRNYARGPIGRLFFRAGFVVNELFMPLGERGMQPKWLRRFREWPRLPIVFRSRYLSPSIPWSEPVRRAPAELLTQPGIRRDPAKEAAADAELPLQSFFHVHPEAFDWVGARMYRSWLPAAPGLLNTTRDLIRKGREAPAPRKVESDPKELTRLMRLEAARLGISAVGVAPYDEKYHEVQYRSRPHGDKVIVAVLEQHYDATQSVPSSWHEQAALRTYTELMGKLTELVDWIHRQGYFARAEDYKGESIFIHYGVQAGLGQLGVNGQLLTPHAGSRARLTVVHTDAPLEFDHPVDYGIEGICDRCQVCVRRCPVGAIPATRKEHRGVVKAKLNTKRCFPITAQALGCAICMKTCPVQKYGLNAVIDEYERSGRILGKDADELEGYDWVYDGKHYGPGERPRVPAEIASPPDFTFDPNRLLPIVDQIDEENVAAH